MRRNSIISNLNSSSSYGFTIIEILVVMSIAVMLAGVGLASFVSYSQQQTLNQARDNVDQYFKTAKFDALSSVYPSGSLCQSGTLVSYEVQICKYLPGSCVGSADYELDAICNDSLIPQKISSQKLPSQLSIVDPASPNPAPCATVVYSVLNGAVKNLDNDKNTYPCSVNINGFKRTISVNP